MAIAWVLRNPRVTAALIGASRVSQVEENVAALGNLAFSIEEIEADQQSVSAKLHSLTPPTETARMTLLKVAHLQWHIATRRPAMLKDLPHNTRITLLLEPLSSVLACILTFYAALYMQANGLDARQSRPDCDHRGGDGVAQPVCGGAGGQPARAAAGAVRHLAALLVHPLLFWTMADGFALFLLAAVVLLGVADHQPGLVLRGSPRTCRKTARPAFSD